MAAIDVDSAPARTMRDVATRAAGKPAMAL
jgi:hypothetical protein